MQMLTGSDAHAALTGDAFVVPPVPAADRGVAWLRSAVARFASGDPHRRRRALVVELLARVPPESLRGTGDGTHPVAALARALGPDVPVALVVDVAQAYQPGTGDDARADRAVEQLVALLGGDHDEATAAHVGILVQACQATADLVERSRDTPLETVLRDHPPAAATKRLALTAVRLPGRSVAAGEVVRVDLSGGLAFGAGPHRCPGEAHARALAARPAPTG